MDGGQNLLQDGKIATIVGNDVWIGDNSVVVRGINIGNGAIIGASAVVTRDVPPYAIVVGNPARALRYRFDPEVIEELLALEWWDLEMVALKGIDFSDVYKALIELRRRLSVERD